MACDLLKPKHDDGTPRLALRPREAAQALAISERLLFQLTKDGSIPCIRLGRAVVYPVPVLQAWLADQLAGKAGAG